MCELPAHSSPDKEHYSIIIFSDSVYSTYPAIQVTQVTQYSNYNNDEGLALEIRYSTSTCVCSTVRYPRLF